MFTAQIILIIAGIIALGFVIACAETNGTTHGLLREWISATCMVGAIFGIIICIGMATPSCAHAANEHVGAWSYSEKEIQDMETETAAIKARASNTVFGIVSTTNRTLGYFLTMPNDYPKPHNVVEVKIDDRVPITMEGQYSSPEGFHHISFLGTHNTRPMLDMLKYGHEMKVIYSTQDQMVDIIITFTLDGSKHAIEKVIK